MKHPLLNAKRLVTLPLIVGALSGCGAGDDWMPMKVGKSWTYRVRAGFERHTVPIRVAREVTVASTTGYELASPLGVSRIAWKSGRLVGESMANARFEPAVPLLFPNVQFEKNHPKQVATWHGRLLTLGVEREANATLVEQNDSVEIGTRKVPAILATLTVRLPSGLRPAVLELASWYQAGVGLVQQEQRTNGTRIVQLTLVGQP